MGKITLVPPWLKNAGKAINDEVRKPDHRPYVGASGPLSGTEHVRATSKGATTPRNQAEALQLFLKSKGFKVKVDGIAGPQTASALKWWKQHGSSKGWGQAAKPKAPSRPSPGAINAPDNRGPRVSAPAAGVEAASGADLGGGLLGGLKPGVGKALDAGYADQVAGLQFDPQIHAALIEQQRQGRQAPQNLADIKRWYGDVMASHGKATARDAEINQAAQAGVGNVVQGILGSLGGSANQGAGMVGSAGASEVASLAAQGAAQDQYNQDVAPLLQAEGAGVSAREMANQSRLAHDLAGQIAGLRGQRGQAEAAAMADVRKYNNDLAQQRFQNTLALEQTAASEKGMGLDIEAKSLRNQQMQAELDDRLAAQNLSPWQQLSPGDKQKTAGAIVGQVLPSGFARGNEAQTFKALKAYATQMGYSNPQLDAMLHAAARQAATRSKAVRNQKKK